MATVVVTIDHLVLVALAVALINAVATLLPVVVTERCCCQATSAGTVALVTLFAVVAALATRSAACDSSSSETSHAFAEKKFIGNYFTVENFLLQPKFYSFQFRARLHQVSASMLQQLG